MTAGPMRDMESFKAQATDVLTDIVHHASIRAMRASDGRYLAVSLSTSCTPFLSLANEDALNLRPWNLPPIVHGNLMLEVYHLGDPPCVPTTCLLCVANERLYDVFHQG